MDELYSRCTEAALQHLESGGNRVLNPDDIREIVEVICKEIITAAVEKRVLNDGQLDERSAADWPRAQYLEHAALKDGLHIEADDVAEERIEGSPPPTAAEVKELLDEEAERAKSPPLAPSHGGGYPLAPGRENNEGG